MSVLRQTFALGRRQIVAHSRSNLGASSLIFSRDYHISQRRENFLLYGGVAILGGAVLGQYSYDLYLKFKNRPKPPEVEAGSESDSDAAADKANDSKAKMKAEGDAESKKRDDRKKEKADRAKTGAPPSWLDQWFAKRFYDGGFEDKMTKREAALILGVRESADLAKVKAAHRRILLLNHPDMGGSPFIASKVNEAKDLLLKGRE
jgi:hypothetical protein